MVLDLYIGRRFLESLAVTAAALLALAALIDLVEQLRRFNGVDIGLGRILGLTALKLPAAVSEFLPLIVVLGSIALYFGLARSSELVVVRAAGRSGIRSVLVPSLIAVFVGVVATAVLNPFVAATENRYRELSEFYRTGERAAVSISREGIWMRQGAGEFQTVIHASHYDPESEALQNVELLEFDGDHRATFGIRAASARIEGGKLVLGDAKRWPLDGSANPEAASQTHESLEFPTRLSAESIQDGLGRSRNVAVYELPEMIEIMKESGFDSRYQEVLLQVELARPLFLVSMVLVGAAFTMRHTRFGGAGLAALAAILTGFGFYFLRNFSQILGETGQISAVYAAWAPPVASILFTAGMLLHSEDG